MPDWRPPPSAPIRLAELSGEVSGKGAERSWHRAEWRGERLAKAWHRSEAPQGVVFDSPDLTGLGFDPGTIEIVLAPAGASSLRLLLDVPQRVFKDVVALRHREVDVPLPAPAAPGGLVSVRLDIRETLEGNWLDAGTEGRLRAIRVVLPGAGPGARLESVTLLDALAAFRGPAGRRVAEAGGVFRPSWYVAPGARVRFRIRVPGANARLRWHEAGVGGPVRGSVAVVSEGRRQVISSADDGPVWAAREAPLGRWAGRRVTLELSASAPETPQGGRVGLALFGDPRVFDGNGLPQATPDVLIYLVDTLRSDALGAWGAERARTPAFDRLARGGVRFRHAQSNASWTKPAVTTLFTGILPPVHRVGARAYTDRIPPDLPLLQERFRDAGWCTGSFVANPLASTLTGLERGFDAAYAPRHWRGRVALGLHPSASQLHEALLGWLKEEPDCPAFAYVHTLEAHEYQLGRYRLDQGGPRAAYARAVADADVQFGALLEALERRARRRPLLLVFLSDHGESFGEHGARGHGQSVYQTEVAVPLVFYAPGQLPARDVDTPVGLADVPATLLDLLGLPPLPEGQGRSLLPFLAGRRAAPVPVPSSLLHFFLAGDEPERHALLFGDLRKVVLEEGRPAQVFDIARDPGELRALEQGTEEPSRRIRAWLEAQRRRREAFEKAHPARAGRPLDSEALERLRTLGYAD
ncbi:MAG: hypothetical protein D6718_04535 [Acidobacteria bacterium]|nr:MAG: hypothetical protein D6718_04535 [Acidobacteriota bacterium]